MKQTQKNNWLQWQCDYLMALHKEYSEYKGLDGTDSVYDEFNRMFDMAKG